MAPDDVAPRPTQADLDKRTAQPVEQLAARIVELEAEVARLRQALADAGVDDRDLAAKRVEWQYDTRHHGIVLVHDRRDNTVKIAQDGDTVSTYWLHADEVIVLDDAQEH